MDSEQQVIAGNSSNDFHSLPDHWQLRSLGEIIISSQYGISSSSGGGYSVPILKMNNLQDGHIDLRDVDSIQLSKAELQSLILNDGDLLINRTNSIDLVGKAAIYNLEGEYVFASYLVRFRLGSSVLPAFVNYFLNSEPGQRKLRLLATKGVSQANINPSILKKRLFLPIPPLSEQRAIAAALSDVDALLTSLDKLIAKKRDIKQATMQQLLTGRTRLPGFSGEWEMKTMEEIGEKFVNGGTPSTEKFEYWQGKIPWITGADVINQKISDVRRSITPEAVKNSSTNIVERGNLLIVTRTGVGKVAIAPFDLAISQDITGIYIKEEQASIAYLFHYFNYNSETLKSLNQGTSIAGITRETLLATKVYLPSLPEQRAITAVLSDMDAEIVGLEQKREKICALKQAMMQELLTGKTRLV